MITMVRKEFKHLKKDERAIAERFVKAGLLVDDPAYHPFAKDHNIKVWVI